jgi:DNA-binding CsgD family transcriptional regulator
MPTDRERSRDQQQAGEVDGRPPAEGLLDTAEDLAQLGTWDMDLRTLEASWSDGMYRIHGLRPGAEEPGVDMLIRHLHPDDRTRIRALLGDVMDRPEDVPPGGVSAEYRALRPDGSVREVRFRGYVERDDANTPIRWIGAAQDLTDQRRTERELAAHHAVSRSLREWGESFDKGVAGLLRRLATALDFPLATLWVWDDSQKRLIARIFWTAPGVDAREFEDVTRGLSLRSGEGIPGLVWATEEPVFVSNLIDDLRTVRRAAANRVGLRSAIAFPAVADDGAVAVLTFYAFDLRSPSDRMARTLAVIGREIGRFLGRHRGELGARRLTQRELEVLRLAAEGHSGPQIAERLFVSPATVKTHFQHIYEKLGVGDRAGAVALALRTGLIR